MKKLISIILVIVMAMAIAMPIFAEETGTWKNDFVAEGTGTIQVDSNGMAGNVNPSVSVTYGVAIGYTLTIPDYINFNTADFYAPRQEIKGENILLDAGETLTVTVLSQNGWKMKEKDQNAVTLDYTMALINYVDKGGTLVTNSSENNQNRVFAATADTVDKDLCQSSYLYCKRDDTNQAGTYLDFLTFTCQIEK